MLDQIGSSVSVDTGLRIVFDIREFLLGDSCANLPGDPYPKVALSIDGARQLGADLVAAADLMEPSGASGRGRPGLPVLL